MVVHHCNPITLKAEAGGSEFKTGLGYIASTSPVNSETQPQKEKKTKIEEEGEGERRKRWRRMRTKIWYSVEHLITFW
jgi:hypothetical protein